MEAVFSYHDLSTLAVLVEDAIEDIEVDESFSEGARAEAADSLHSLLAKIQNEIQRDEA